MKSLLLAAGAIVLTAAAGSCTGGGGSPTQWTAAQISEGAVLYREAALRTDADFSLRNVLKTILASEGLPSGNAQQEALLATLLQSLSADRFANPVSGLAMAVQVRATERGLSPARLLDPQSPDGLIPVGLFNRIDLMPDSASDCGEHRIVYSTPDDRFLLIFEAKLPNKAGGTVKDCAAIGAFWAKAGQIADGGARLAELKKLYFQGVAGFAPVVRARHYGKDLGQVRSNTFRDSPWMLREWRLDPAPKALIFQSQPVASNPLAEFYQDNNNGTLNPALPLQNAERLAFQDVFTTEYNPQLLEADTQPGSLPDIKNDIWLLNTFGARVALRFDEFQSDSQTSSELPRERAGPAMRAKVKGFQVGDAQHEVTPDQVLRRAAAITCGGCHGPGAVGAVGKVGGQVVQWPASLGGFRHIDTGATATGQSEISDALSRVFLPFRRALLLKFLQDSGAPAESRRASSATAPDQLDAKFTAIIQGGNVATLAATIDDFRREVAERRAQEQAKPGLFVRNRRPH